MGGCYDDFRAFEVSGLRRPVPPDCGGQPVPGLTKEDFQVFEDGQAAEVTSASSTSDQPRENDSIIRSVRLDSGGGLLRDAVPGSGGRIIDLTSVEEIPTQLTTLLRELREQYVLGITPRRIGHPGSWRDVRVEVPGGLQIRTQDGYFEP